MNYVVIRVLIGFVCFAQEGLPENRSLSGFFSCCENDVVVPRDSLRSSAPGELSDTTMPRQRSFAQKDSEASLVAAVPSVQFFRGSGVIPEIMTHDAVVDFEIIPASKRLQILIAFEKFEAQIFRELFLREKSESYVLSNRTQRQLVECNMIYRENQKQRVDRDVYMLFAPNFSSEKFKKFKQFLEHKLSYSFDDDYIFHLLQVAIDLQGKNLNSFEKWYFIEKYNVGGLYIPSSMPIPEMLEIFGIAIDEQHQILMTAQKFLSDSAPFFQDDSWVVAEGCEINDAFDSE